MSSVPGVLEMRDVHEGDFEAILPFMRNEQNLHAAARPDKILPGKTEALQKAFVQWILDPAIKPLILLEDGRAAGYCVARFEQVGADGFSVPHKRMFIDEFYIRTDRRRAGLGKFLFYETRRIAVEAGASSLELAVWEFNEAAQAFYNKMGMKPLYCVMEWNPLSFARSE